MARGGLMIPVHWATFSLAMHCWVEPAERLIVAAEKAGIDFVIPRPGESVDPASPAPVERWWPDVPWETADQHPIVSSRAPRASRATYRPGPEVQPPTMAESLS